MTVLGRSGFEKVVGLLALSGFDFPQNSGPSGLQTIHVWYARVGVGGFR